MSIATAPRKETRPAQPIPPLQAGDRLTRAEFERRYRAMPHVRKAELIEGVVYMPSPVSNEGHASPHVRLSTLLGVYWFVLREGAYERLQSPPDGIYRSEVFPGLWLDAAALLAGDLARAIQVVQQGLASPEHAEFAARLQHAYRPLSTQAPQA